MDEPDFSDDLLPAPDMSLIFNTLRNMGFVLIPDAPTVIYDRGYARTTDYLSNLQATSVAAKLGVRSVDGVRRRYGIDSRQTEDAEHGVSARDVYIEAYFFAAEHMRRSKASLRPAPDAEPTFGTFAGAVAMERLEYSLLAAHVLYQLRLRYEADAVARHVLEQIAWSVAVAHLDDEEAVAKIEPQKQIASLTRLTAAPHPGMLYGALSSAAHAGLNKHREVTHRHESRRLIIKHGITDWYGSADTLLALADLWVIAYETLRHRHMTGLTATEPSGDGVVVDHDREYLAGATDPLQRIAIIERSELERETTSEP